MTANHGSLLKMTAANNIYASRGAANAAGKLHNVGVPTPVIITQGASV